MLAATLYPPNHHAKKLALLNTPSLKHLAIATITYTIKLALNADKYFARGRRYWLRQ